jgi:cytochrome b pre-mRNA-processing protein 3
MLNLLRKSAARKALGTRLHALLVSRAREPVFFREFAVPDTIDGRFDLLTLHAWLALEHLSGEAAQGLTDALFIGFDEAMREQGAGDMGLGRKMKQFADAYYGRLRAYGSAADEEELGAAIARNLYRGAKASDIRSRALADYATAAREHLKYSAEGDLNFGPLPALGTL